MKNYIEHVKKAARETVQIGWHMLKPAVIVYSLIKAFNIGGSAVSVQEMAVLCAIVTATASAALWLHANDVALVKARRREKRIAEMAAEQDYLEARQIARNQKKWDYIVAHYDEWRDNIGKGATHVI